MRSLILGKSSRLSKLAPLILISLAFLVMFHAVHSSLVGLFGMVVTWTDNSRCRSRVLLRCKLTRISRIPRSLIICEGGPVGDNGDSWTVLVFVLNSHMNDVVAADEDNIPTNANPHPENPNALHFNNVNPFTGNFEDA